MNCLRSTPTGSKLITSAVCLDCPICIDHHIFIVDLICLPTFGPNIILRMNWLSANQIILDCYEKIIRFSLDRQTDPYYPSRDYQSSCNSS